MFCPECGEKNNDDSNFCHSCGAKLTIEVNEEKQQQINQSSNNNKVVEQTEAVYGVNEYYQIAKEENKTRKGFSTKQKVTLLIVAFLIIAIGAFWGIGRYISDPKRIAKSYFQSMSSNDWNKAYSYLDVKDSDFISKESFAKVASAEKSKVGDITNFSVIDTVNSKKSMDELTKSVEINYTVRNSSSPISKKINLVKQKEKKFLFFDSWKVEPENLVVSQYTVYVPKNTTLTIDNVKVNSKYIVKGNDTSSTSDTDTYKLTNIFYGKHELKINSLYTEDYSETVDIDESGSHSVHELKLKKQVEDDLVKQVGDVYKEFYKAALTGKSYDTVKDYFTSDEETQKEMQSSFEYLVSKGKGDFFEKIKDINFTNFKEDGTAEYSNSYIDMSLTAQYTYTSIVSGDDEKDSKTLETPGTTNLTVDLVLEGGKWKISRLVVF
ncbi:zinc-ribbon domain-containing protein [Inconstantimicrobium mannanitabidum]|uniref:Uncharacterized protein n=1 Tax=Inconstantimicrobium mannanitabidum TaxID=1604901 RepID=A0ACB5RFV1_9CLOT|nr:zinc-ribbon domain-containing protein [Clostridium sp. TW13]GKX67955.1 hypothetical protein rsdtw13_32130 [Clostridium sp. TW13]